MQIIDYYAGLFHTIISSLMIQTKKNKQKLRSSGQLVRLFVFYFNFYCSDFKCVYLLNHISGRFFPMLRFEEEVQGNVLFKLWMDCISSSIIFILLSCIFYLIHGNFCHFVLHIFYTLCFSVLLDYFLLFSLRLTHS